MCGERLVTVQAQTCRPQGAIEDADAALALEPGCYLAWLERGGSNLMASNMQVRTGCPLCGRCMTMQSTLCR